MESYNGEQRMEQAFTSSNNNNNDNNSKNSNQNWKYFGR